MTQQFISAAQLALVALNNLYNEENENGASEEQLDREDAAKFALRSAIEAATAPKTAREYQHQADTIKAAIGTLITQRLLSEPESQTNVLYLNDEFTVCQGPDTCQGLRLEGNTALVLVEDPESEETNSRHMNDLGTDDLIALLGELEKQNYYWN